MRNLNIATINLIKAYEGCVLKAYRDAVGVWTIGYGHTTAAGDLDVTPGLVITQKQADDLLAHDLQKYQAMVDRNVKVQLNDNQYGALVSWTYNLGEGSLKSSTLLRKINAKDFVGATLEFSKWNKADGKVLAGLTRRRAAEARLFNTPVTDTPVVVPQSDPVPPAPVQPETPKATVAPSVGLLDAILSIIKAIFGRKS